MAKRHNHYEAAFEDYLRAERIPYVATNEQRRALAEEGSLKNLDFLLSPAAEQEFGPVPQWLVDVKGRRFPSGRQYWRNWTTRDELESLAQWERRFGEGFRAALVFAYQLMADQSPVPVEQIHYFRDEPYAFVAVSVEAYCRAAQTLSPSWGTLSVPTAKFRQMARPLGELFVSTPELCTDSPDGAPGR